jgi:hypothetical protein
VKVASKGGLGERSTAAENKFSQQVDTDHSNAYRCKIGMDLEEENSFVVGNLGIGMSAEKRAVKLSVERVWMGIPHSSEGRNRTYKVVKEQRIEVWWGKRIVKGFERKLLERESAGPVVWETTCSSSAEILKTSEWRENQDKN